jgi:peroxiredoxin
VGNLAPEFALRLADGSEITATELRMEGRPVFLYFLTGW